VSDLEVQVYQASVSSFRRLSDTRATADAAHRAPCTSVLALCESPSRDEEAKTSDVIPPSFLPFHLSIIAANRGLRESIHFITFPRNPRNS
jgi:hypothetical protein